MSEPSNGEMMAYPVQGSEAAGTLYAEKGLTKRELFAAMVLQGLCARDKINQMSSSDAANWASDLANHLLIALNAEPSLESASSASAEEKP